MAITRFAPSPTGYLHIGGLRTALYSYLLAKKTNGEFKIRIEDTDKSRNNDDAVKAIFEAFNWVGMPSDCTVEYQSKRTEIYKKYVKQLLDEGKAYKCYMSKEELQALREEQEANKETPRYNGKWRPEHGKTLPTIPNDIEPVIRIKAPTEGIINFKDGVKGDMQFTADQVDDFVIARSNGVPTYNFVVAIDDYLMKITDVLRGDDHLSNTPKQIIIYNALGFNIPKFYHIPMINNPQGKKLSKRDGAMDVMEYKRKGYLPEALLNFLVRLGWSNGDQEIFSIDEMIENFNPNNINKSASSYNEDKLKWLNAHYLKHTPKEKIIELLKEFDCDISMDPKKELLLDVCIERAETLLDLKKAINAIIIPPRDFEQKGVKKFIKDKAIFILQKYINILDKQHSIETPEDVEKFTKPYIEQTGLKYPQLFQPIRICLTGGTQAPSVYDIIAIIGKEDTLKRLDYAILIDFDREDMDGIL